MWSVVQKILREQLRHSHSFATAHARMHTQTYSLPPSLYRSPSFAILLCSGDLHFPTLHWISISFYIFTYHWSNIMFSIRVEQNHTHTHEQIDKLIDGWMNFKCLHVPISSIIRFCFVSFRLFVLFYFIIPFN